MLKAERHEQIVQRLTANGTATVGAIARALQVSEMTIRRDLEELAERGIIERVYGGARLPVALKESFSSSGIPLLREYSHVEKRRLHTEAKREVARRAAQLIKPGESVFLGAGTTVEAMIEFLPAAPLRIVTNSLSVFKLLEHSEQCELYLVGGLYRRQTGCFVGSMAEDAVAPLGIDKAFIGTNGVASGSLFTSDMDEGKIQRMVLDKAQERYAVCDASKVGRCDFYAFYSLSKLTALICDSGLDRAHREELSQSVTLMA